MSETREVSKPHIRLDDLALDWARIEAWCSHTTGRAICGPVLERVEQAGRELEAERDGLEEQLRAVEKERDYFRDRLPDFSKVQQDEFARAEELQEQYQSLDQWSRDVLPQLSRLIDIIEGRHEDARLVAPHGQTSATPHALLDRWRSLHSNPAKSPQNDESRPEGRLS